MVWKHTGPRFLRIVNTRWWNFGTLSYEACARGVNPYQKPPSYMYFSENYWVKGVCLWFACLVVILITHCGRPYPAGIIIAAEWILIAYSPVVDPLHRSCHYHPYAFTRCDISTRMKADSWLVQHSRLNNMTIIERRSTRFAPLPANTRFAHELENLNGQLRQAEMGNAEDLQHDNWVKL